MRRHKNRFFKSPFWRRYVLNKVTAGIAIVAVAAVGVYFTFFSHAATPTVTRTANAVQVVCSPACGTGDDTAKFQQAITNALNSNVRYANGPGGQSQAVVYVPAGTYRLKELTFPSNLRMEVDAGAILEQAGGTSVQDGTALIRWDGPVGSPLQNVSLVGVGSSSGGIKTKANPVATGRSIDGSFTFNIDPQDTNSSNKISGLMMMNVKGFLVQNVFSVENDYRPDQPPTETNWYPTTQKSALGTRARADSPCSGPFAQPTNGTVTNWYNIQGPKGYGPTQVGGATNVTFSHIFTQGGTGLRLETDSSEPNQKDIDAGDVCPNGKTKFGSEIRGLIADDIEGLNCNRAVSFSPHLQDNYDVQVTNVKSTNCAEAVVLSRSPNLKREGSFNNSTIANITVTGGNGAQLGIQGQVAGYWSVGTSLKPFWRDGSLPWDVIYSGTIVCSGTYQQTTDLITPPSTYNGGKQFRPACPGTTTITGASADTTPPTVSITTPSSGQTVSGSQVALTASASDNTGVTRVDFLIDNALIGSKNASPYTVAWDSSTVPNGSHDVTAKAFDAAGNSTTSTGITITVSNQTTPPPDTTPPATTITSPAANATLIGNVTVTATSSDNVGVSRVELYIDDVLAATDIAAPYKYAWDTTSYANGKHTLETVAYDAANNSTVSSTVHVVINNPVAPGPKTGDVNNDNSVNIFDAAIVANNWGHSGATKAQGDLNNDGVVNIFDAAIVANNWGH